MRDIKIKFTGKAPSGFESGIEDFCSALELELFQKSGEYKLEVLDNPNKKSSKAKKSK